MEERRCESFRRRVEVGVGVRAWWCSSDKERRDGREEECERRDEGELRGDDMLARVWRGNKVVGTESEG